MTPERRKQLLAALIKDRDQTRATLNFIEQQKQHEEALFWETGNMREPTHNDHAMFKQHADTLICRNEETIKAWFDSVN